MTEAGKRLQRAVENGTRMNEIQRMFRRLSEQIDGLAFDVRTELAAAKEALIDEESRPRPQLAVHR